MKAALVETLGEAPVLGVFPQPEPTASEHLIAVEFAALSQLTRGRASGRHYSDRTPVPFVPGVDGVGRLSDGQRVYFVLPRAPFGAMAERSVADRTHCVALPDGLDPAEAAALANPGMSSWAALTERARLVRGETVLVNGATGASGRLAIGIARHLGASRVIATGRNKEKLQALGADAILVLDADPDAFDAACRPIFEAGVDVVLDYLCGDSAKGLLMAAAKTQKPDRELRFVQIGSLTGPELVLPAAALRSRPISVMGSGLGSVSLPRLVAGIGGVFAASLAAKLSVRHRVVPLAEVNTAWTSPENDARIVFAV